jgi:hypothetical protein
MLLELQHVALFDSSVPWIARCHGCSSCCVLLQSCGSGDTTCSSALLLSFLRECSMNPLEMVLDRLLKQLSEAPIELSVVRQH